MTDARRAVLWMSVLLAIIVAGDHFFAWGLRKVILRSEFRFSTLYRGGNAADVLILGDSRGVHSFYAPAVEELTGMRAFNLSYNGMSTRIAEAVLFDYLDRNKQPRMVIIEVTSVAVKSELTSELRTYAAYSPRLAALYGEEHPSASAAGRLFHLLGLNTAFYVEALRYLKHSDQEWINRSSMPPGLRDAQAAIWRMPTRDNLAALSRMIEVLHRRGVEVRLVLSPYRPMPANMPDFANVVVRSSVTPIWNYAEAIRDPDLFADTIHLNERGSRALLTMMKRDGVFGITVHPTSF